MSSDITTPMAVNTPTRRRRRRLPLWAELPLLLAVAVLAISLVQNFVAQIYVVPSASMEQTLHGCPGCDNDRVVADRTSPRLENVAQGDIVVFRGNAAWTERAKKASPPSPSTLATLWALTSGSTPGEINFVKRVIAGPGQTVACCDAGRVTVDGVPLDEPYVYLRPNTPAEQEDFAPVTLGPGELWMMGDNRNSSADSRDHGPVAASDVLGEVRAIAFPFSRMRVLPTDDAGTAPAGG